MAWFEKMRTRSFRSTGHVNTTTSDVVPMSGENEARDSYITE